MRSVDSNRGSDSVLAVYTWCQQLQIASQKFCQLIWHMSKHPPCYFLSANPLGQRSDAPGCVIYATVLFLAMISFLVREQRLGMLVYRQAFCCQRYSSYLCGTCLDFNYFLFVRCLSLDRILPSVSKPPVNCIFSTIILSLHLIVRDERQWLQVLTWRLIPPLQPSKNFFFYFV